MNAKKAKALGTQMRRQHAEPLQVDGDVFADALTATFGGNVLVHNLLPGDASASHAARRQRGLPPHIDVDRAAPGQFSSAWMCDLASQAAPRIQTRNAIVHLLPGLALFAFLNADLTPGDAGVDEAEARTCDRCRTVIPQAESLASAVIRTEAHGLPLLLTYDLCTACTLLEPDAS
jgi:hypothetical protein